VQRCESGSVTHAALHVAGVASTSIMWGPWATGMAAQDARLNARFARAGLATIAPSAGLCLLTAAVSSGHSQLVAAPILWDTLLKKGSPPFFEAFLPKTLPALATEVRHPEHRFCLQINSRDAYMQGRTF